MLAGIVIAFMFGPPCESWCAARACEGDPKPLRDRLHLWGLNNLNPSEWNQVILANKLMQTRFGDDIDGHAQL